MKRITMYDECKSFDEVIATINEWCDSLSAYFDKICEDRDRLETTMVLSVNVEPILSPSDLHWFNELMQDFIYGGGEDWIVSYEHNDTVSFCRISPYVNDFTYENGILNISCEWDEDH